MHSKGVYVKTQAPQGDPRGNAQRGEMDMRECSGRAQPLFQRLATTQAPLWYDNDPSAGSPTETLLRLLLPLNDQV